MIDLNGLMTVIATFFVVAASPGPATLAVASVSMGSGRKSGLRFGMGLAVGLAFWGIIAATGLGTVLQTSMYALILLKIFGGVYLLLFAYKVAYFTSQKIPTTIDRMTYGRWFKRGLILNLSNPKAVVAWIATLSMGLENGNGIMQVTLATSLCAILGFFIYFGYAFVFSMVGAMKVYARIRRWIDGVVAGLFAIAGIGLLRSAFIK